MAKPTILILDPCRDTRAMYAHYLRHHGYETVEAANGAEGVRLARWLRPGIVVTELSLPSLDAFAVIRALRSDEPTRDAAIVVCATSIDTIWPYAPAGVDVDSALAKPVSPRALLLEVEHVLARRSMPVRAMA